MIERNIIKEKESSKFKGKFIQAIGRRKTSVAQIRLFSKGHGTIIVNEKRFNQYFNEDEVTNIIQPLKLVGHARDLDFSILVKGGGKKGQADAVRHGLSRALVLFDNGLREALRVKGWLTRDARQVERKKPGLKKARRAPQWSKR